LFTPENSFKLKRAFFCFYILLQKEWSIVVLASVVMEW
jgi:hypothetical protein